MKSLKIIKNQKGMTLIEIMVVITILGIIATAATLTVMSKLDQAKVSSTGTQIKTIETALDSFKLDNGFYPTSDMGLKSLVEKPSGGRPIRSYPKEGYIKGNQTPKDAWGNEFLYFSPGTHGNPVEIISLGADGQEGGEGPDADINSWEVGQAKGEE